MKKYQKGKAITSLDEMIEQKFIYVYDKIYHIGWASSWSVHLAKNYIDRGIMFEAELIKKGKNNG